MVRTTNKYVYAQRRLCKVFLNGQNAQAWTNISSLADLMWAIESVHNVYRIELDFAEETYDARTGRSVGLSKSKKYSFWVADTLTTPEQIATEHQGTAFQPEISDANKTVPAIKTATTKRTLSETSAQGVHSVHTTQHWHPVSATDDIVINKKLQQIYPNNTGAIPNALLELTQHVR